MNDILMKEGKVYSIYFNEDKNRYIVKSSLFEENYTTISKSKANRLYVEFERKYKIKARY